MGTSMPSACSRAEEAVELHRLAQRDKDQGRCLCNITTHKELSVLPGAGTCTPRVGLGSACRKCRGASRRKDSIASVSV